MNFEDAIRSHVAWKLKLGLYLGHPDRSLKVDSLARDDECDLGRWIYGEGARKYSALDEFTMLRNEHRAFHRAAADVVIRADAGANVSEDITLGAKSAYGVASNAVVTALMRMKAKVG